MAFKVNQKKLIFRLLVVLTASIIYFFNPEKLIGIIRYNIVWGIKVYHILWSIFALDLIKVLFPNLNNYISCGKHFKKYYIPSSDNYDEKLFLQYTNKMNQSSIFAMFLWIVLLFCIGMSYSLNIIGNTEIIYIVILFYFFDQICINIWCPFQTFILGNKCCNSCRIYNWGYFMLFSPFIFIINFYTTSLFILSFIILIQWEYLHFKYPQRFSEITNLTLRCKTCKDQLCKIKGRMNENQAIIDNDTSS